MSNSPVVYSGLELLGGTVVCQGTGVPLQKRIDFIQGGYSLKQVLEDIPTATYYQAIEGLETARALLTKAAS